MVFLTRVFRAPPVSKWYFNLMGYYRYGLRFDDLHQDYPELDEAIRRMPQHMQDERIYRILRAGQCEIRKEYLPKEQWTKYEDDDLYLKPYLDQVLKELKEKEDWTKKIFG